MSNSGDPLYDGDIYVVNPKNEHLATVVWLHALGDNGSSWSSLLRTPERSQHIKWICPTAPSRNISTSSGSSRTRFTAWFDLKDLSKESLVDEEDLNNSAKYVARLLAGEPPNIKLVVGGYGMGAATALHFAIYVARGKLMENNVKLSAVVAYSGWLPKTDWTSRLPAGKGIELIQEITSSMPICLLYDKGEDPIIPTKLSDEAFKWLSLWGFKNVECKRFKKMCNSEQYPYAEAAMGIALTWLHEKLKPSKGGQPKATDAVPRDSGGHVTDKIEIPSETNPK